MPRRSSAIISPTIFSMPLAFLTIWLVSVLDKSPRAAVDRGRLSPPADPRGDRRSARRARRTIRRRGSPRALLGKPPELPGHRLGESADRRRAPAGRSRRWRAAPAPGPPDRASPASRRAVSPASGSSTAKAVPASVRPLCQRIQPATASASVSIPCPRASRAAMGASRRCGSFCEPSIAIWTCAVLQAGIGETRHQARHDRRRGRARAAASASSPPRPTAPRRSAGRRARDHLMDEVDRRPARPDRRCRNARR